MNLLSIADELTKELGSLQFGAPVTHVYNPLEYARGGYVQYVEKYGKGPREVVLLGMNPGPFGMAQTGVPFGDPVIARTWLGIEAVVGKPTVEHPRRPVLGFGSPRREVSGTRVWGWAEKLFRTPECFFERFLVANYCPLVFMEETGRNRTPDGLSREERARLFVLCDRALERTVDCLGARVVVGIGKFAEGRARAVVGNKVLVGGGPHPSPANPGANRGWAEAFSESLSRLGIQFP